MYELGVPNKKFPRAIVRTLTTLPPSKSIRKDLSSDSLISNLLRRLKCSSLFIHIVETSLRYLLLNKDRLA